MDATILLYDGTYEGLLSAIFESYRLKIKVERIVPIETYQDQFFSTPIQVDTNLEWAKRVVKGVEKKTGKKGTRLIYNCFLSEHVDIEMLINHFIKTAMSSTENIVNNYRDDRILALHKINKKIGREVHRMHAFVRFQKTKDDIYAAIIEPDFNVMPLIGKHFEKRYPAQKWLIYDTRRHYGIYYNLKQTTFITFDQADHQNLSHLSKEILSTDEPDYQVLWKSYFNSVNIPERNNAKLHLQHVPKRYWKYLVEKW